MQTASLLPFGDSMASALGALDVFWAIEPLRGNAAYHMLRHTSLSNHRAAYDEAGVLMSLAAVLSATKGDLSADEIMARAIMAAGASNEAQPFRSARSAADTTGAHRVQFGQNADGSRKPYPVDGGVALLAITGPMTKEDAPSMSEGTSTVRARRIVRQAKTDGDVKATLIRFDTPGGTVRGNDDLANDIRDLAIIKPCYAYIEDMCASAGYYCASQCTAIYANPSALVGSISTLMTLIDCSKMFEAAGVDVKVIAPDDAPFKGAGTMGAPIGPDQLAYFKEIVTAFSGQFKAAVRRGRGMNDEQLKAVVDGRVFPAAKARSLGLIDGVTSYEKVLAKLKSYRA